VSARNRLRANDARFHSLAVGFTAEEWSQPSLCDDWSNHDVLAHLVVGYSAGAAAVARKYCATVDHSIARTLAWPNRWPLPETPGSCSTNSRR